MTPALLIADAAVTIQWAAVALLVPTLIGIGRVLTVLDTLKKREEKTELLEKEVTALRQDVALLRQSHAAQQGMIETLDENVTELRKELSRVAEDVRRYSGAPPRGDRR